MAGEADVFEIIRNEWREAAPRLADWAMAHLVNRKDVWGQYTSLTEKEKLNSKRGYKALTLPQKSMRGQDMVTLDKLTRHFRSSAVNHIIGLHAAHPDNTSRWLALDIDLHEPDAVDAEDEARRNFAAATAWWEELQGMGYDPLLLDSNGAGGYHLLVLFADPAPMADVHALGQRLVSAWKQRNIDGPPEQFPKSAQLGEDKLGAWLRLFGRHHTRRHFTKVWSGDPWLDEPWLEGSAAIDTILTVRPGPPPPKVAADGDDSVIVEKGKKGGRGFEAKRKTKPAVCVDLDGVLARYDGWAGKKTIGDPLPGALEFLRKLQSFAEVIIYSSRIDQEKKADAEILADWLNQHQLPYDAIHQEAGKPKALAFIDDRAVTCQPQAVGPAAYAAAEQAARTLCSERDPDREATPEGQLGQVINAWPDLSEDQREDILQVIF